MRLTVFLHKERFSSFNWTFFTESRYHYAFTEKDSHDTRAGYDGTTVQLARSFPGICPRRVNAMSALVGVSQDDRGDMAACI
jgi:hypothetical protein